MLTKKRREERGEVVSGSGTTVSFADKNVVPLSRLAGLSRLGSVPRLLSSQQLRFVSQSKPAGSTAVTELHRPGNEGHGEVSPYLKNPDYHGFSSDPVEDTLNMRVGTFIHYLPDLRMRQWREREGLPLISENYYDTEKIVLPSSGE
uniref:NADH dehydrogenase [ubiquinone] 1 beta subcomplex subunit 11, mitochondrial n=1 Tax=Salarias fasciatus TaxID=181472 RepID=A0A672JID2_SALFA